MFSVSKAKNLTKKKEKLFLELSRITSKKEEECLDIPIQRVCYRLEKLQMVNAKNLSAVFWAVIF